jgi:hypothetical protein
MSDAVSSVNFITLRGPNRRAGSIRTFAKSKVTVVILFILLQLVAFAEERFYNDLSNYHKTSKLPLLKENSQSVI